MDLREQVWHWTIKAQKMVLFYQNDFLSVKYSRHWHLLEYGFRIFHCFFIWWKEDQLLSYRLLPVLELTCLSPVYFPIQTDENYFLFSKQTHFFPSCQILFMLPSLHLLPVSSSTHSSSSISNVVSCMKKYPHLPSGRGALSLSCASGVPELLLYCISVFWLLKCILSFLPKRNLFGTSIISLVQFKECLQCRRHRKHGFDPWIVKLPWRTKWQLTPVFLPEKSHGQKSPVGLSP